jgi:hypothetical protein
VLDCGAGFLSNKPNENPQRQVKLQEKPNVQVFSKPQKPTFHAQPKQEFHVQPKAQVQERPPPHSPKPEFRARAKPRIQEQRLPQQPKPQQLPGKKLSRASGRARLRQVGGRKAIRATQPREVAVMLAMGWNERRDRREGRWPTRCLVPAGWVR